MYTNITIQNLVESFYSGSIKIDDYYHNLHLKYNKFKSLRSFITFNEPIYSQYSIQPKGVRLPLFGIPVSLKDNINVVGMPTTSGTLGLRDFYPVRCAPVVNCFQQLGVSIVGKNNMHELSFGVKSNNKTFGNVIHPHYPSYSAGGSSSGCAVAVAAGIVPCALGTDTGGSVRIPASFCGVVGFKPTKGCYPHQCILSISHTKDTVGLITRTAQDCLYVHSHYVKETSVFLEKKKPIRIGIPEKFLWSKLDAHVKKYSLAAIDLIRQNEIELIKIDDSIIEELNEKIKFSVPIYEFFINFTYYLQEQNIIDKFDSIINLISDHHAKQLIKDQIEKGLFSYQDYVEGLLARQRLKKEVAQIFSQNNLDAIVYPTVPCQVPSLKEADEDINFTNCIRNTDPASNLAMPSVTIPVASKGVLPVGLSIDGLPGKDLFILEIAVKLEKYLAF
ncbi:Indoleacetamide hydrolase [Liberibacter crescens BT-1]|uniref:Indoleacetamide hydrolase n=1 Tax=Liberibacter crescens (strain BT-1) TaxID=1215343 RepID=L0ESA9_LIBCB|nr:amidase family protein [Liberibacter crescens]AGA64394.1 Indoleacetamide hydrolase [Liberibacter crescens BT-1]AMC12579.1 hypothetical protein RL73_02150 [Liberibacter crescens]